MGAQRDPIRNTALPARSLVLAIAITVAGLGTCGKSVSGPSPLSARLMVAAGDFSTCAIGSNGAAYCWGRDEEGELGIADTIHCLAPSVGGTCTGGSPRTKPVAVVGRHSYSAISAGGGSVCALATSGQPWCWGLQLSGDTVDDLRPVRSPVAVAGGPPLSLISTSALSSCGLTANGTAYCWGSNDFGQLGTGDLMSHTEPVPVLGGLRFTSIATGVTQTCAVTAAGAAYCWGTNSSGELGNPSAVSPQTQPIAVAGGVTFSQIYAGVAYTCGLTSAAYCWGDNSTGELGDGMQTARPTPVPVGGGLTWSSLALYNGGLGLIQHTCGITVTHGAFCWGDADNGALGTTTTPATCSFGGPRNFLCSTLPVLVAGGQQYSALAVGQGHTCGITAEGAAYCWGQNDQGQVGDGTTTSRSTPMPVAGNITFR